MALDKVQPLKIEDTGTGGDEVDLFPTALNPQQDHIEAAGVVLDDATHRDETTRVWRDGDDLRLSDTRNTDGPTLSSLRAGGSGVVPTHQDQILFANTTLTAFIPARIVVDNQGNVVCGNNGEIVVGIP